GHVQLRIPRRQDAGREVELGEGKDRHHGDVLPIACGGLPPYRQGRRRSSLTARVSARYSAHMTRLALLTLVALVFAARSAHADSLNGVIATGNRYQDEARTTMLALKDTKAECRYYAQLCDRARTAAKGTDVESKLVTLLALTKAKDTLLLK